MTNQQELIAEAMRKSGLDANKIEDREHFAEKIMGRHERTVRRWLKGTTSMEAATEAWLRKWNELSEPTRDRILGALR